MNSKDNFFLKQKKMLCYIFVSCALIKDCYNESRRDAGCPDKMKNAEEESKS